MACAGGVPTSEALLGMWLGTSLQCHRAHMCPKYRVQGQLVSCVGWFCALSKGPGIVACPSVCGTPETREALTTVPSTGRHLCPKSNGERILLCIQLCFCLHSVGVTHPMSCALH